MENAMESDDETVIGSSGKERGMAVFRDINPEAVTPSGFMRGLANAGGGVNLVEQKIVSDDIKTKAVKRLLTTNRKHHPKKGFNSVLPLANPKGVTSICEMCTLPGRMYCIHCGVTFYCSTRHQVEDVAHERLCERLCVIRGPTEVLSNRVHRSRNLAQRNLVTTSLIEEIFCSAVEKLHKLQFEAAYVGFRECASFVTESFGETSCEAVTLFIFMADSSTFQNRIDMAKNSLNMATFELRELEKAGTDGSLHYTKALLFRSEGLVDMAEENFSDASFNFAECVYHSAERFGGYHVRVCSGYYYLGRSFIASGRHSQGFATLGFCVDLWLNYLGERFRSSVPDDTGEKGKPVFGDQMEGVIPRFLELEAEWQLTGIDAMVRDTEQETTIFKAVLCGAIIHFFNERYGLAKDKVDGIVGELVSEHHDRKLEHLAKRVGRVASRREWQLKQQTN